MKITFANATGCPVPQFVVTPDSREEKMLLKAFFGVLRAGGWEFHCHGETLVGGEIEGFNFGLKKIP